MSSPRSDETKGATFTYKDPQTGELYNYSRRGSYKKNGRFLVFVKKSKGANMSEHILNQTDKAYSDEVAGYPPNCNKGYVAKDWKCVPVEEDSAEWKKGKKKNGDEEKKNGDDEEKNGKDKKKNGNPFEKKK